MKPTARQEEFTNGVTPLTNVSIEPRVYTLSNRVKASTDREKGYCLP